MQCRRRFGLAGEDIDGVDGSQVGLKATCYAIEVW